MAMTRPDDFHDRIEEVRRKLADIVARKGWAVMTIAPTAADPEPRIAFAYTVGLSLKGLPELFMSGLPLDVMHPCLNSAAEAAIAEGAILDGMTSDRVFGGSPAMFRSLPDEVAAERGKMASLFAPDGFEGAQVIFTDPNSLWPWDPGCEPTTKKVQDFLHPHPPPPGTSATPH